MTKEKDHSKLLTVTFSSPIAYEWSIGKYGSRFFQEVKEHRRFIGIRCPQCGKVYVPPRKLCGPCFKELDELIVLSNMGKITAFSIVNYPFVDPATGEKRPIPYTYGYINIDGSSSIFSHIINETDANKLRVGMKVKAVFKEKKEMQGNIQDIKYFEIVR